uniref:PID domain-containing protein n=1 Tax=Musca domestica TaxID=7370 RepID=A0A1I8MVD1_MUSDO
MGRSQDLLDAARTGNISVVGKILEHYAKKGGPLSSFRRSPSLNAQDMNGYTPLHHACLNGHEEIVRLLLSHDAATDVPDIRGSTPLYLASWADKPDIVRMLLMHPRRPANPNAQNSQNETPLHCAAEHGHNAVVAILLSYGADPTIRNNSFQTALDLASQFGRLQVVQILIRTHPELIEPFRVYDEIVALENGHSPPYTITPTKHIFTHSCLHLAARNGHKKVVETLLAAGVDVNILTNSGSALHEAALCGKKSVVCTLLRAGIDLYAVDGNGRTALDVLTDYPPHVTYEIVSIIKDFCQESCRMENNSHFIPIKDVNDNTAMSRYEDESKAEQNYVMEQQQQQNNHHQHFVENRSMTMNSLDRQISIDRYTPMEPILNPKSTLPKSNRSTPETLLEYKPVYATNLLNRRLGTNTERKFPKLETNAKKVENVSNLNSTQYHCVDEYVEMTLPTGSACNTPRTPKATAMSQVQTPLPSPRRNLEYCDYANISAIMDNAQNNRRQVLRQEQEEDGADCNNNDIQPKTPTATNNNFDTNNNNNDSRRQSQDRSVHSPTPDYPPPTAFQAETTIFEFVKPPPDKSWKRKSLQLQNRNSQFYNNLKSFIWEEQMEPPEEEQFDSISSSRVSECVEEFVGDVPFAGLFKGSSLNLASDAPQETGNKNQAIEELPSGLRSPSLVKSVRPMSTKRSSMQLPTPTGNEENSLENGVASNEIKTPPAVTATAKESEFDFDASKVWDEINTIFESIGNEVSAANNETTNTTLDAISDECNYLSNTLRKKTLTIRKPAELLLISPEQEDVNPNWCHSANTLIYGYVLYDVYYLGSTVIRELHGTVSTRKSIQKLKREETPAPMEYKGQDGSLIEDINCSTRILKETNAQTRLKVGIALSHAGVRFIDTENKSTISVHDIENINCVSQDTDDLRYFAYITREKDTHYCHVFMVDSLDLATEIILTLGQAFEVAYQLSLINQEESLANNTTEELTTVEEENKRISYCDIVDNI